ncbi:MAG: hypothetical protein Q9Q13_02790 [Acidobacteriota bacterium]|nr:hypothetical protein [Acidobacteriota bacterium]
MRSRSPRWIVRGERRSNRGRTSREIIDSSSRGTPGRAKIIEEPASM